MGRTPEDSRREREDTRRQEPSLELPTLRLPGLGRRRRRGRRPTQAEQEPPQAVPRQQDVPPQQEVSRQQDVSRQQEVPPQQEAGHRAPSQAHELPPPGPAVSGWLAAPVTGVLVAAVGAGLTWLGLAGCEAVRGTSTCGRPGFFLLVAIVLIMALLGAGVLTAVRLASPASTSVLGVGIICVITMLVLLDLVYSPWIFVVLPAVGAAAYALSFWVTTRFSDEPPSSPPVHDVR
jgi:hypothetical protein